MTAKTWRNLGVLFYVLGFIVPFAISNARRKVSCNHSFMVN